MAKPAAPEARDRVLKDEDLLAVWKASEALKRPFGSFYRLLILTGQRRDEVAGMRWSELDRQSATWTIPADRAKNGKVHIVPLPAGVIAELDTLVTATHVTACAKALDDTSWPKAGYVLTTTGRKPISGFSKAKAALDAAIIKGCEGEPLDDWRVHDLRRTVATGLQRMGVRFEVTEAVLNHVSGAKGGVAGIYQRHDWKDEKKAALSAWAAYVSKLVEDASRMGDGVNGEAAA
jgi:integrase